MSFNRTHNIEDIHLSMKGQKVVFGGWVEDLRKLGKLTFLTVRDVTGITQAVVKEEPARKLEGITRQSVIRITGIVQDTKARDFDCEVKAESIEILSNAVHPLPIDPIGRLESRS